MINCQKGKKKSIKYYVIFKRELEIFCRNTSVVVFMYLGKKNKIKPVEENFQTKALVYFTQGFAIFQIHIFADSITIMAKTFTRKCFFAAYKDLSASGVLRPVIPSLSLEQRTQKGIRTPRETEKESDLERYIFIILYL